MTTMINALAGVARTLPGVLFRRSVVGRRVVLERPGSALVWVACTDRDWPAMLDAQNAIADGVPGSEMGLGDLARAGRAFWTMLEHATVLREELGRVYVRLDDGREGWVQVEFTRAEP